MLARSAQAFVKSKDPFCYPEARPCAGTTVEERRFSGLP